MLFTLKKFIGGLLLPLPLLVVIAAGLVLLWLNRGTKTARLLLSVGWLTLLALSLQPVADRLLAPLEAHYPTWQPHGETVKWIVVLGGGYTWNPDWLPAPI